MLATRIASRTDVRRRRGEDVPAGRRVGEPDSDVPRERGLVAGAAAHDEPHLRSGGRAARNDPRSGQAHQVRVGRDEAFEHLVDGVERVVDDLLEDPAETSRCCAISILLVERPQRRAPAAGQPRPESGLAFAGRDLVHLALRVSAGELGGEPDAHQGPRELGPDDTRAHGHDLGVVRLARPLGRVGVVHLGGANSGHLVGGDRHADPGAADQDPAVVLAAGDGVGNLVADVRVVDPVERVAAVVLDVEPFVAQQLDHRLLELEARFIAADRNLTILGIHASTCLAWSSGSPPGRVEPSTGGFDERSHDLIGASARSRHRGRACA